jgi:FkbM family methyltransferase
VYKSSKERTEDYLANFDTKKVLQHLITSDTPVIVDVGANVGQTLSRVKKIFPSAIMHCIEPVPEHYDELKEISKFYDDAYVYNLALGDKDEEREFNVNQHQPMLSSFYELNENSKDSVAINKPEASHSNFLDNEKISVQSKTLDTWATENNITHIDMLKMDTQGSEPEILAGGVNVLNNTNIIVTELMFYDLYKKQNSFYDIESIILPLGFELFDIGYVSKNPLTGRTDWVDVIYKKRDVTNKETNL